MYFKVSCVSSAFNIASREAGTEWKIVKKTTDYFVDAHLPQEAWPPPSNVSISTNSEKSMNPFLFLNILNVVDGKKSSSFMLMITHSLNFDEERSLEKCN